MKLTQKLNILSALVIAKEIEEICPFSVKNKNRKSFVNMYILFVLKKMKKYLKKKLGDLYCMKCTGCVHTIDGAPSGATALD